MIRRDWSTLYPNDYEMHGIFSCSDHCPIVMSTQAQIPKAKAFHFRLQIFWMKYQDVDVIISRNWRYNHYGTNIYRVMRKLRCVKHDVKDWSKRYFGNFNDKLSKNSGKIDHVEERLITNLNSHRFNS